MKETIRLIDHPDVEILVCHQYNKETYHSKVKIVYKRNKSNN